MDERPDRGKPLVLRVEISTEDGGEPALDTLGTELRTLLGRAADAPRPAATDEPPLVPTLDEARLEQRSRRLAASEHDLTERNRELDRRERELERVAVERETDIELREDAVEQREAELAELEQRLGRKERELVHYVAELQDELLRRETWWNGPGGSIRH
jgi:hypothetical protein